MNDKQLKKIADMANKEIHKNFPLLHEPIYWGYLKYVFEAYGKVEDAKKR